MAVAPLVASTPWFQRVTPGPLPAASVVGFTATYDAALGRVVLLAVGLNAGALTATLERFDTAALTNADTVRGGTGGLSGTSYRLSDYEYTPGVVNTYRLKVYGAGSVLLHTLLATVTPNPSGVWLKSIARPFLNRQVSVVGWSDVATPARGGVLEVIGRRLPVAITEVRGSRRYSLVLRAADRAEADALELALSFGDVLYVQPPSADCPIPSSLYAFVGDVTSTVAGRRDGQVRYFTLPLTEVSAPDPTVVGYGITYAGVKSTWATYAALKAAVPTYLALQEYVAAPVDEVVG